MAVACGDDAEDQLDGEIREAVGDGGEGEAASAVVARLDCDQRDRLGRLGGGLFPARPLAGEGDRVGGARGGMARAFAARGAVVMFFSGNPKRTPFMERVWYVERGVPRPALFAASPVIRRDALTRR